MMYPISKPVYFIGEKIGINFSNPTASPDRWYMAKSGMFFLVIFLLFWMILHFFVHMISSLIAKYLLPAESCSSSVQKTDAKSMLSKVNAPGVRQRNSNGERSKAKKEEPACLSASNNCNKEPLKRVKFNVAFWKAVNYSFLVFVGLKTLRSADWLPNYHEYAIPLPLIEIKTTIYYHLAIASYLYGFFCLLVEPHLKDFMIMVSHHLVTLLLLIGSYYLLGSVRIGMVVMILHDICDPFMEIAKLCLYADLHLPANVFFVSFALIFIVSRCVIYPTFVIHPLFILLQSEENQMMIAYAHLLMLCIIFFMDVYWTFLILKMIVAQLTGKSLKRDIREEVDNED